MKPEEIIRMAREAGMEQDGDNFFSPGHEEIDVHITDLERFAALVADAEAKRIHDEGMVTVGHMREQIAAEREACANKVEVFARKWWSIHSDTNKHRDTTRKAHDDFCTLQAMIRARGNT